MGPWPRAAGASVGSGDQQVQPLSLAFVVMVSAAVVIVAAGGRRKNRPRSQTGYLFGKDAR